jgi:phosphohistidine phosphatase
MGDHRLIIMRHGKSDWSEEGQADFDRPLARRGAKAVPRMAAWLAEHGLIPDRIIASPALRARQTAEAVAEEIGFNAGSIIWDERIYANSLPDLLGVVADGCGDATSVLIIGHNPGLEDLLQHLSATPPPLNEEGKLLTTAALAVLDYGDSGVHSGKGGGKLLHLVRPGELK